MADQETPRDDGDEDISMIADERRGEIAEQFAVMLGQEMDTERAAQLLAERYGLTVQQVQTIVRTHPDPDPDGGRAA